MLLVASLGTGAIALPAAGAGHPQAAVIAKKCKKKMPTPYSKKRRCKKKRAVLPASISISPTSQDFGIPPPFSRTTRTFVITNAGGSLSGLPVPIITGQNSDSFGLGANSCVTALPPGNTCQIDVDLFPRGAGPVSATLSVVAVPGGTVTAALTGDIEV